MATVATVAATGADAATLQWGAEFKDWVGFLGVLGFVLYPVVLLSYNFLEGREANKATCDTGGKGIDCMSKDLKRPIQKAGSLHLLLVPSARAVCRGLWYSIMAVVLFIRLLIFCTVLAPWFLKVAYAYCTCTSARLLRGIRFGPQPRNFVDIYLPSTSFASKEQGPEAKAPVVIAVMGGAWVIGYRAWNALLGFRLAQAGVLVVGVDYRNFPGATYPEMIGDVERAIGWVLENIESYGGDPKNVALIGQSAGAHLSVMALLKRCGASSEAGVQTAAGATAEASWSPRQLRGYVGVSGVYDLPGLEKSLQKRGVYPFMEHACAGAELSTYSPVHLLQGSQGKHLAKQLPPIKLFHGEADASAPVAGAQRLEKVLSAAGAPSVAIEVRPGMKHCEPVVEDPFTGGDLQVELVLPLVLGEEESKRRLASLPADFSAPGPLVWAMSAVMPF